MHEILYSCQISQLIASNYESWLKLYMYNVLSEFAFEATSTSSGTFHFTASSFRSLVFDESALFLSIVSTGSRQLQSQPGLHETQPMCDNGFR